MKKLNLLAAFCLAGHFAVAQDGWLSYPASSDSTRQEASRKLDYSQKDGKVTVHGDARLDQIEQFLRADEESIEGIKIDGFRVLIFFDQSKSIAEQKKASFISIYPEHQTYVDYLAPNYRVRVGNFRTRLEAEKLKADILGVFPTAIVIEDKIQLPSLNKKED
ncbi:MAG: hypothetical protein MI810_12390 [Flavobacteriales bacterium]|jgi:hypothetical protein|nr:hypothetical protein [Flavobacteriales bacterium]